MAKRKDAVALFEVITATKRKEAAAANAPAPGARPLRWWFKRKPKSAETSGTQAVASRDANDPTAGAVLPPTYVPVAQYAPLPVPVVSEPAPQMLAQPAPPAPAEQRAEQAVVQRVIPQATYAPPVERVHVPQQAQPAPVQIPSSEPPRRRLFGFGVRKVGIDPDRQEVTLRLSYTTAVVAGFALIVVIGLAIIAARRNKPAVAGPNSPSTEEIRNGAVLAGVLDVGPDRVRMDAARPADAAPRQNDAPPRQPAPREPDRKPAGATPQPSNARASGAFEDGLPRIKSLNYIIIQTYPKRSDADAAQQALDAAGIDATVERVPKDWAADSSLWSVIGTRGFTRIRNVPEYQQYLKSIMAVSDQFAGKTASGKAKYRRFEPAPRKWQ